MKSALTALELREVSRKYGSVHAVRDVTLHVNAGETLALLGPSGCGKSTLLRVIAGLERPDGGSVWMHGVDVTREAPERRDLSLVFQDYALFPHLNVLGNVAYGPRARGLNRHQANERALAALDLVAMREHARRPVTLLSGGQQQRVALARALAPQPRLLLLDEPLSNLDEQLRVSLQEELRLLFSSLGVTVVLVTHDQREALALAGRVALMREGRVVQAGPARELYERPRSAWVAAFLGHRNLLPRGRDVLLVPEEAVQLGEGETHAVLDAQPEGRGTRVRIAHALGDLLLTLSPREAHLVTGTLRLHVQPDRCLLLPNDLPGNQ